MEGGREVGEGRKGGREGGGREGGRGGEEGRKGGREGGREGGLRVHLEGAQCCVCVVYAGLCQQNP